MNDSFDNNPAMSRPSAPIEFRCTQCRKLLRIGREAAGQQAQCPDCGAIVLVPMTGANLRPPTAAVMPSAAPASNHDGEYRVAPAAPPQLRQPQPQPQQQFAPQWTPPTAPAVEPAPAAASSPQFSQPVYGSANSPIKSLFDRITAEIRKIYVGQDELVLGTLVALFSSGHVLIESVPGLGKTLFVRTLGRVLGCQFGRIQFTADLMPSDITGAPIFDMKTQEFRFRPGPVFTQFLLADEINRSPAKTHAALLEIMQEYRVTIERTSHKLKRPFLVLATQNPIESEGTYNLPEAQLDRFMFKIVADYPTAAEEADDPQDAQPAGRPRQAAGRTSCRRSPRPRKSSSITQALRPGAGRRQAGRLHQQARAPDARSGRSSTWALRRGPASRWCKARARWPRSHGRDYAVPDDVVQIALPALRHRVILTAEAEVEGHKVDDLLRELIRSRGGSAAVNAAT